MSTILDEDKFESDHEDAEVEIATPGEGGKVKPRRGDKPVNLKTEAKDEDEDDNDEEEDEKEDKDSDEDDLDEAFDAIFGDTDLSEDAKAKMSLIFKAAIKEGVALKTAELEESTREALRVEVEERVSALVAENEQYMDYVAETFMEENKLAIETGLKVEIAESLIESLKSTLIEHNIVVDTDGLDLVEDLESQLETVKEDKNAVEARNLRLIAENRELKAEKAFNEIAEGLTDVEKDRLFSLSEALSIKDVEAYKEGLSTIRESFFKEDNRTFKQLDVLDEGTIAVGKTEEILEETFAQKLLKTINS